MVTNLFAGGSDAGRQGRSAGHRRGRRGSVLIVEDDFELRNSLAELLSECGYEVEQASQGQEALSLLRSDPRPRILLLDLMMPVMSGWELYEAMQEDPKLSSYPVVALSAFPRSFADPRMEFLQKPVHLATLLRVLDEHCGEGPGR